MALNIKELMPVHLNNCANIGRYSDETFWTKKLILKHSRRENCGVFVALMGFTPVGFLAFEVSPDRQSVQILNLVVHPKYRRKGIGRSLVQKLTGLKSKFQTWEFNVRESNLDAQLFLQKLDFLCVAIARSYFIDYHAEEVKREDAYCFAYPRKEKHVKICIVDRLGRPVADHHSSGRDQHVESNGDWRCKGSTR